MGVLLLAPFGACERAPSKPPKLPASYVRIAKLSPDATRPLKVGDKVNLQVQLDYALTKADTGAVMVVVQTADNQNLVQKAQAVRKGVGKATLAVDFVVPQTSAVKVFTPLSEQGQTSTTTVALRTYKVVER
jgi:glucan biosynthesis protein